MQKSHCLNVKINASGAAVSVSGNVELVIEGTNTLHSGTKHAGVEKGRRQRDPDHQRLRYAEWLTAARAGAGIGGRMA